MHVARSQYIFFKSSKRYWVFTMSLKLYWMGQKKGNIRHSPYSSSIDNEAGSFV